MTSLPPPPPDGWVLSGTGPPPRRVGLILGAVFAVLALLAAGVGGYVVLRGADASATTEIAYPTNWDPRVQPFVGIVEKERALTFMRPIYVDFLAEAEFRKQVTRDEEDLTDEDKEEIEQFTGLLRAVGLVQGELDLFKATNELSGSGTLGYYSFKDKRIRVRGEALTPAVKNTLVHELTHALQDQHFDLGTRKEALEDGTSGAQTGFDAIIEGDASRIETAYQAGLSKKELAAYRKDHNAMVREFRKQIVDLPPVMQTMTRAPYDLGEALLQLALTIDGNESVDRLFKTPPTTDENLLDPWTLLLDKEVAAKVDEPQLEKGDKKHKDGSGDFGSLTWYVLLAARIPVKDALAAADGWGGDAYLSFDRDGTACMRANIVADTPEDGDQLYDALERWVKAAPGAPASVKREGGTIAFESCDPGTEARVGTDASQQAMQLALIRTAVADAMMKESKDQAFSRCFAQAAVDALTIEELSTSGSTLPAGVQQRLQSAAAKCRS